MHPVCFNEDDADAIFSPPPPPPPPLQHHGVWMVSILLYYVHLKLYSAVLIYFQFYLKICIVTFEMSISAPPCLFNFFARLPEISTDVSLVEHR